MKKIVLFLFLCLFVLDSAAVKPLKTEIRAVWLATVYGLDWPRRTATNDASRKLQQQALCEMLDKLQEANFNTVFFQARLRGDVAYRSSIEPFSYVFTGKEGGSPGYDPLAFAIEECHKRGMECHAWFVTFPLGKGCRSSARGIMASGIWIPVCPALRTISCLLCVRS